MRGSRLVTTERVVCIAAPGTEQVVETIADTVTDYGLAFVTYEVGDQIEEYRIAGGDVLGVVVGGDGTFLRAVEEFAPREIPFLSVDAGTLGFLMVTPQDAIRRAFAEILSGDATVTEHVQVHLDGEGIDETGINEVQFDSGEGIPAVDTPEPGITAADSARNCSLEVFIDGEYVGRYDGYGILVNTPTGSTATALSAGGPVHLPAENRILQVTPLHTHSTAVRPLITDASAEITVVPQTPIRISVDGARPELFTDAETTFTVTGAEQPAYLIRGSHSDPVMDSLRAKLGWTPRSERRPEPTRERTEGPTDIYETAGKIAREAAFAAGKPVKRIHGSIERSESGVVSDELVGAALSRSEQIIGTILQTGFPTHTVVSEGWTLNEGSSSFTWVIDPLDGTGNFAHGNPSFTISIALLEEKTPVVGVVYSPVTDDLFHAITQRGAYRNETKIQPTDRTRLEESMLLSGYDPTGEFLKQFYRKARGVRRLGTASLHLCYVAAGSADAHWEYDTYPWDVAAGLCILREAGGTATHSDGSEYKLGLEDTGRRTSLLTSNGPLHQELLAAFPDNGF